MREHIRTILANGDPGFDSYIILVRVRRAASQRTGRGRTNIQGQKGSGKTIFAQTLADFFGQHGKVQTDPKRLTGQFNAFLRDTSLLFLDEMRWSSRRDDEGILQTLITGRTICIEDKNIPQYEWPNHLHIVFCSNSDRVIPASEGERRYAVGETNDRYAKDMCPDSEREAYFNALYKELEKGGGRCSMIAAPDLVIGTLVLVTAPRPCSARRSRA
jgi:tRNA A37 threonylcarbamoyladenosine biosynthesis protein TsaE